MTREAALAHYQDLVTRLGIRTASQIRPPRVFPVQYVESCLGDVLRLEGEAWVDLDAITGKPYSIQNQALMDRMDRLPEPCTNQPQWTSEEAQRKAEDLLGKLRGGGSGELHVQKADFVSTGSYRGSWHVVWSTTYKDYEIENGWMDVYLNEESGLVMYRGGDVHPPPSVEVRLSKDEAVSKAEEVHKRLSKDHNDFLGKPLTGTLVDARLVVVNPNYRYTRFQVGAETKWGRNPTRDSRLAWVVRRELKGTPGIHVEQSTWVDAATGEILGGFLD